MIKKKIDLSFSSIILYLFCARKWYYNYQTSLPKRTTYPLLAGSLTHRFIAYWLYRKISKKAEPRTFFYKNIESAIKSWKRLWCEEVEKNQTKLILPNQDNFLKYMAVGVKCIKQYWQANYNLPRPLAIEKKFETKIMGIKLIGFFDQLRTVSLEYIIKHRPTLVKNGKLIEGYDPVVILDLKSHYLSYAVQDSKQDYSEEEELRWQFALHEDLQPTIYTFLYEQQTGKKPIGFVWYHLRSGKGFFTFREDRDYNNLFDTVKHVCDNVINNSFPKRVGNHCRNCDFFEACREDRNFILAQPEGLTHSDLVELKLVSTGVKKKEGKQLELKLRVKRKKKETPLVKKPIKNLILYNLPWD